MKVLFVTQEITRYLPETEMSLVGRHLPQAIQELGHEIRTFMPKFGNISERRNQLHEVIRLSGMNLVISDTDHPLIIKVASIQPARMQVYFIDNEDFFQRKHTLADKEKEFLSKHLTYDLLDSEAHAEMFPESSKMIVKVPKKHEDFIEELENSVKEMYDNDTDILPSIHFDKHLYSPIASFAKGEKFREIKTVPTRLNEGERDFLNHLRGFIKTTRLFEGKELFVLRNLSVKGMGFFMESSSFYPDFIVWVVDNKKQHIYFLDPKGILLGDNHFNNPKILWCKQTAPVLGKKIQQELLKDKKDISVSVSAFILSHNSFDDVRDRWGEGSGTSMEDFADNNVLFIENNKDYLFGIFSNLEE